MPNRRYVLQNTWLVHYPNSGPKCPSAQSHVTKNTLPRPFMAFLSFRQPTHLHNQSSVFSSAQWTKDSSGRSFQYTTSVHRSLPEDDQHKRIAGIPPSAAMLPWIVCRRPPTEYQETLNVFRVCNVVNTTPYAAMACHGRGLRCYQ